MATEWVISSAAERVKLSGENRGETSFTVTNPGSAPDRVVFEPVAGDGADASWFFVEEPQRLVGGGASVSYVVKIVAPPGATAGSFSLQGRAYSADTAPEEGSRLSGRVAFDVRPSEKPKKPWWPYAVAAGVAVVVLATVGYLIFRPKDEPPPPPAGFPSDARLYAEAVLAAWGGNQSARLADLTSAPANQKLAAMPGPPNMHWTFVDCDGAAGSSYCSFYNDSGETILVRLTNQGLGSPHAVTDATLSGLPEDGVEYTREFVRAWQRADHTRMLQLGTQNVVDSLKELAAAPQNPTFTIDSGGGGLLVVKVASTDGFSIFLQIGTTLLGQQHAIVGYA
jgi:hypothetical protein